MPKVPHIGELRRGARAADRIARPRHREDAEMMSDYYAAALARPRSLASWALGGIGAALCLFLVAAALTRLDEVARVDGTVMPAGETRTIAHRPGGVVASILVHEGDEVKPGQVLLRIENRDAQIELREASRRLVALTARAARLAAEANGHADIAITADLAAASTEAAQERELFRARRERLAAERKSLEEQQRRREQELVRQEAIIERLELKLGALRIEYGTALRAGAAERPDLPRLQRETKDAEAELAVERLALLRIQIDILESRQALADRADAFADESRKELGTTESEIARLKARLEALAADAGANDVSSPLRGIVKQLRVALKGTVRAGEPLVEIAPLDETLVIEGRVRPADFALLRLGQPAHVRIAAADRGLEGSVFEIIPDASESPEAPGGPYFRIKVRAANRLESGGKAPAIGPGTQARIAIKIGERTLLAYILKPFATFTRPADSGNPDRSPEPESPSDESL